MARQPLMLTFANPLMSLLLRSPWHSVASREVMLIAVTGRKSGKTYTTPVNYVQEGNLLSVISQRKRTWWRNLRGGATVIVYLRGKKLAATAEVIEDTSTVAASLLRHLRAVPQYAEPLGVGKDENGQFMLADVARASTTKVMVHVHLLETHDDDATDQENAAVTVAATGRPEKKRIKLVKPKAVSPAQRAVADQSALDEPVTAATTDVSVSGRQKKRLNLPPATRVSQ